MTKRFTGVFFVVLAVFPLMATGCRPRDTAASAPVPLGVMNPVGEEREAAPTPRFVDVARTAGLNYRWAIEGKRPLNILQTIGNGCAFLDYDSDGNLDILMVGPKVALYRGDGKGHFTDVSPQTGIADLKGNLLGCAVGDYDADGFPDIYLTAYRGGALLHNDGGKRFRDVSKQAGIPAQPWGASAAWADVNGDGTLDLFVGNYAVFGPKTEPQLCREQGIDTSCGPRHYQPEKNALFLHDGAGKFRNATGEWAVGASHGKTLGAGFAPLDESGRPALLLANDEMPGDLMRHAGGKLENFGAESGVAYDVNGNVHGGMGLDWGDFDNDHRLDAVVSTFQHETKCVYRNVDGGVFNEVSVQLQIAPLTAPRVAFGVKWLDWDNDGWLDLAFANGHVQDNIERIDPGTTYRQKPQLFRNENGKRFAEVSAQSGPDFGKAIVGRGLATGDFDNDGRIDILLVDSEGEPLLLHNETPAVGHWAGFLLKGNGAEGALVTIEAGGTKRTRLCTTGGSYMSASDPRIHLGLGAATAVDRVTVRWANGATQSWQNLPGNQYTTLPRAKGK